MFIQSTVYKINLNKSITTLCSVHCILIIGRPVKATITLYPIGRPVRIIITLYPIGRPIATSPPESFTTQAAKITGFVIIFRVRCYATTGLPGPSIANFIAIDGLDHPWLRSALPQVVSP